MKPKNSKDLEKIAKTIVIQVKENGTDPYDLIKDTGFPMNLMESLLHKVNVGMFLDKYHRTHGPDRTIVFPKLDIPSLHERMGEGQGCSHGGASWGHKPTITIIKKKTLKPLGLHDIPNLEEPELETPAEPIEPVDSVEPEEKEASVTPFEKMSSEKVAAAREQLEQELFDFGSSYLEGIQRLAKKINRQPKIAQELQRCYGETQVVSDIFSHCKIAKPEPSNLKWVVASDKPLSTKVAGLLDTLEQMNNTAAAIDYIKMYQESN